MARSISSPVFRTPAEKTIVFNWVRVFQRKGGAAFQHEGLLVSQRQQMYARGKLELEGENLACLSALRDDQCTKDDQKNESKRPEHAAAAAGSRLFNLQLP